MNVEYRFLFEDGREERFALSFDDRDRSLDINSLPHVDFEPWMELSCEPCEGCELNEDEHPLCPIATNLASLVVPFQHDFSYTPVVTTVVMQGRNVSKQGDLQEGIRAMMGLVMATSGCTHLDKLRPMAYSHLPFSTIEETFYRAVSSYALAQLVRVKDGLEPNFDLSGLRQTYIDIQCINLAFSKRMREIGRGDANINALISLDVLAQLGASVFEDGWIDGLKPVFASHLQV